MEEKKKTVKVKAKKVKSVQVNPAESHTKVVEEKGFVLIDENDIQTPDQEPNRNHSEPTEVELIPQTKCPHCGATVNGNNAFCPKCGNSLSDNPRCSKCGHELDPEMQFCPNCGSSTKKEGFSFKNKAGNTGTIDSSNLKKNLPIILAAIAIIGVLIYFASGQSKNKLEKAYDAAGGYSLYPYVTLSDDKQSIKGDTNPYNNDDDYASSGFQSIKNINESLGLPEALWDKLLRTRALDGTQTATYDDIVLSWTYHPDNGLEIIYELAK